MAMKKKRAVFLVVASLIVLSSSLAWLLVERPSRLTKENIQLIREGISLAEVKAILGEPGDYTTQPLEGVETWQLTSFGLMRTEVWAGDRGSLAIKFDENDNVFSMSFWPAGPIKMGSIDLLKWRINRMWERWTTPSK
jgi:hypothetical protein